MLLPGGEISRSIELFEGSSASKARYYSERSESPREIDSYLFEEPVGSPQGPLVHAEGVCVMGV